MFVKKEYPSRCAIGERVDEIENHHGQHAHIREDHRRDEHEKFQHIAAIRTENLAEAAACFRDDRMVALEHGLVHREIGDTTQEDDEYVHGRNIGAFAHFVIWSENNPPLSLKPVRDRLFGKMSILAAGLPATRPRLFRQCLKIGKMASTRGLQAKIYQLCDIMLHSI